MPTPTPATTGNGLAFAAPTGKVNVASGNSLRLVLTNPTASGVIVGIWAKQVDQDFTAPLWGQYFINPTAGIPASSVTPIQLFVGNATLPKATVVSDNNATPISGGTAGPAWLANVGHSVHESTYYLLQANNSFGVNIVNSDTSPHNIAFTLFWSEE